MSIYYQDEFVTLYHGDCLEILHSLNDASVDAVITDPPYASGARTEASKSSSGAMVRGVRWSAKPIENDQMTTTGFVWLMREVAYGSRHALVNGGAFACFIDWRQWPTLVGAIESTNMRVNGMVVWDKESYGLGNGFRSQHELLLYASKGVPTPHDRSKGNVLRAKRVPNDDHPSPKPVSLLEEIMAVCSPVGGLIVDPFAGSGSTLIAARNLKRKAIGVEIEERYCEVIANRLAQGVLL